MSTSSTISAPQNLGRAHTCTNGSTRITCQAHQIQTPPAPFSLSVPTLQPQVLGAKKKNLAGFSTATLQPHQGFISQCAIIQQTPPSLRVKAARLVAAKCTLLARVDAYGQDPNGAQGTSMREDVIRKIEKWQVRGCLPINNSIAGAAM